MKFLFVMFFCLPISSTLAAEFPAQGRVYVGMTQSEPKGLNSELTTLGLENVDGATFYGVEIVFPLMKFVDIGFRYAKHRQRNDENPNDEATEFYSEIDQDAVAATIRIPFIKSAIFRVDAFAGYGGSNTTIKIKSASQNGTLEKKDSGGWLAEPYSVFGASLGLGYKQVYFVMEAGYQDNSIDGFKKTGSVTANVKSLDLSGSYFSIGFLFDGIKATN